MTTVEHPGLPSVWAWMCFANSLLSQICFQMQDQLVFWCCFAERNTSITISHITRATNPSIRSPASNEMVSDPVELWDTDVCFWHILLMGGNVRLPNLHKIHPEVDFHFSKPQQKSVPWNNPIYNAELCCPHESIDGSHLCYECLKLILPSVCVQACVHLVTDRASLFTDHRTSGLPIRTKYKHF